MKKTRVLSLLLAACLAAACLTGCAAKPEQEAPAQPAAEVENVDVLRIGTTYDNSTFSAYSQDGAYGRMNYNGMSQLNFWRRDENNELTGDGCFFKSWEISEDNTQLTLHFDPLGDLYFHNGEPVTIDDVLFSFEFYKAQNSTWFLKITDITQVDETSISLTFDSNYAFSFMNEVTLSYYILSEKIWSKVENPKEFDSEDAAIGCGPYKLVSVDEDAQVSYYEAVENYPIEKISVDRVELHSFDDQSALLMALADNKIDAVYGYSSPISTTLIPLISEDNCIALGESLNSSAYHVVFGFNKYPTNDLSFRKAVRYALDFELLRDSIAGSGFGKVANEGAVSPACLGYDAGLPENTQDIEKSNILLDEAGFLDIDGDGVRELPNGEAMDVKIAVQSGSDLYKRIAEIIQINMAGVGIKSSIDEETVSNEDYTTQLRNDGSYEIYIGMTTAGRAQWTGVVNYVADIMSNKKWGTYADEAYMSAYNGMLYAGNYNEYIDSFTKAQEINSQQAPVIALAIGEAFYPYRTDVITGWTNYPSWGVINGSVWYTVHKK